MLSENKNSFTSFFLIYIPFISFSCLISFSRMSSTMLKKSSEKGHLSLYLNGKASSFSPLSIILAVEFLLIVLLYLRMFPSIPSLLRMFIINRYWILSILLLHLWIQSCDFSYLVF